MTVLIEAHHVHVRAAGSLLLDDVSFSISSGELVLLAGPNGAGKTTLLKALLGLIASAGEIRRKPGLRLAYLPQHLPRDLSLPLTVERFVSLFSSSEVAKNAALARTGADALATKQLASLSGGEMARVQLARALAREPELLVLDEPFAGLDTPGEEALLSVIAGLRTERACGVVLVSHDLDAILGDVSRIVLLDRRVVCEGPPAALEREPAMRRLLGRHHHG